jgi:hypothetical protein
MRGLSRKPGDLLVAVAQSSSRGELRERNQPSGDTDRVAARGARSHSQQQIRPAPSRAIRPDIRDLGVLP